MNPLTNNKCGAICARVMRNWRGGEVILYHYTDKTQHTFNTRYNSKSSLNA